MKTKLTLIIIMLSLIKVYAQKKRFYVGVEIGVNKVFHEVLSNDNEIFINPSVLFNETDDFFGRNHVVAISSGLETKNKLIYEFLLSVQVDNKYSGYNFSPSPAFEPELYRWNSSTVWALKWTFGFGKKIDFGKKFSVIPAFQASYLLTGNESSYIFNITRMEENYVYQARFENFTKNHFLIGIKNTFQWKASRRCNINLNIGYLHGLVKSHAIKQEIFPESTPDVVYTGHFISYLSHGYSTLGFTYYLNK
ncbi:MAG: hypothetical protein IPM42_20325 [Saprospiraceae bacterium]|nr:hypothetical protein [Saprospiraceae bacterium]